MLTPEQQEQRERILAALPKRHRERVGTPSAYKVKVLPSVGRASALRSRHMNGKITELAAVTMPRTANRNAAQPRSKVTGITAGSNLPRIPSDYAEHDYTVSALTTESANYRHHYIDRPTPTHRRRMK